MAQKMTPMMQQYFDMKEKAGDSCLLFFRMGDFYEMFNEDAVTAAQELDLVLTSRDRNKDNPEQRTPMCGVPHHSVQAYIGRLVEKGYKVAICEQMQDPSEAKGLVERDIIRIVTPGTLVEESILREGENNFLCAIYQDSKQIGLCLADISTGEVQVTSLDADQTDLLCGELSRFLPREAILSDGAAQNKTLLRFLEHHINCRYEVAGDRYFRAGNPLDHCRNQFGDDLAQIPDGDTGCIAAAGGLLSYLDETQRRALSHLIRLQYYAVDAYLGLDDTAVRNLELLQSLRNGEKKGSLLWAIDRTKTGMGARLLRRWITRPLRSMSRITQRSGYVLALKESLPARELLTAALRTMPDLERLAARLAYGNGNARDLAALAGALEILPEFEQIIAAEVAELLPLCEEMDALPALYTELRNAIADEPPIAIKDGGMIRSGYNEEVDQLRGIRENGARFLADFEQRERERTGIKNLKIGYNRVFGYYIEISKSNYALVPDDYLRKQTLVNCERFITGELKEMESTILSAADRLNALEYELFCALREQVVAQIDSLQKSAKACARLDALCSLAQVGYEWDYVRPEVNDGDTLDVKDGRHPVVEQMMKGTPFVPNDSYLNCGDDMVSIITGPNMAGKSTYMRQVALLVILAQMGALVPARSASVGLADKIFTRIGASDDLAGGSSTFMVEMREVADMLTGATAKSLLILDEIGRGTSTFDGMSIARAVLEHCADKEKLGARTLFATHYHELTELELHISGVRNYNIAAQKRGDEIVFLRKIVPGGADKSYGVEVAKLAGLPDALISRAKEILSELERDAQLSMKL